MCSHGASAAAGSHWPAWQQLNPLGDGLGVANRGFRPGDRARAGYRGSFSEFERDVFGQLGRLPAAGRKVGQVQGGQGIGLRETEIVHRADIGRTSVRSGF